MISLNCIKVDIFVDSADLFEGSYDLCLISSKKGTIFDLKILSFFLFLIFATNGNATGKCYSV